MCCAHHGRIACAEPHAMRFRSDFHGLHAFQVAQAASMTCAEKIDSLPNFMQIRSQFQEYEPWLRIHPTPSTTPLLQQIRYHEERNS
jgi:hypothetical protein